MSDVTTSSVACNHCGAPLSIPPSTRFVTCAHCGSRLEIHRSGNALYSEVLEAIDQRTREIAQDVDVIRRQNEVERLDREWAMRREELMVRGKNGRTSTPSIIGGIFVAVASVAFGIFWMSVTSGGGAPAFFPLIGFIIIIGGLISGVSMMMKAGQYGDAERRYQEQRSRLLGDVHDNPPTRQP